MRRTSATSNGVAVRWRPGIRSPRLVRYRAGVAIIGWSLLALPIHAQDTNNCLPVPTTKLEAFETNLNTVIIKATADVGSISANAGLVSVKCKEMTDAGSGRREQGIAIELTPGGQLRDVRLVDYEEITPLLEAIDYLNKMDWSVTSLTSFDAVYTTKSGLRLAAFSSRRSGVIEFAVRDAARSGPPILLSRDQVAQFQNLIEQAKTKLDSLRRGK